MSIQCGRGPHSHESVDDVRRCFNGEDVPSLPRTAPTVTAVADEPRATEKQIAFVCSLAAQKEDDATAAKTQEAARDGRWGKRSISEEIRRLKALPSRTVTQTPKSQGAEPEYDSATYDFRPRKATESHGDGQTPVELEAGMYRMDETIYKVQLAVHGSGHPYAKKLRQSLECGECGRTALEHEDEQDGLGHEFSPNWKFEYAPGAIHQLRPEHRMTLEQAKEFGALYGTCCVCGRTLTNEESIENGIGPVCGSRV